MPGPSFQLTAAAGTHAYISSWTSDLLIHPLPAGGGAKAPWRLVASLSLQFFFRLQVLNFVLHILCPASGTLELTDQAF
jgi:hypothetical protein